MQKRQKCIFNFEIYRKKSQNGKRESKFIWIFCILNLKIQAKKKTKKGYFFQIRKIHMQKKVENNISKKHAKNAKKAGGAF